MITFFGNIEAKLDVKGRVFIPSTYRKCLPEGERGKVVLRVDADNDCLLVYPLSTWERVMKTLQDSLDEWDSEDRILLMQFVSEAELLDIDSQGRILVSKKYSTYFSEGKEVVFVGMVDRLALWSKVTYENNILSRSDLSIKLSQKMSGRK